MANNYNIKVNATLNTKGIQEALKGVESKYGNIKVGTGAASGIKSIGVAAKESKGMLGEFTSQLTNLSSTIPKVAAFGVATMAVNAFKDAIADGVQQVIEYDKSIEELEKVVGSFTDGELRDFSSTIAEIGEELSATMTDVTNSVTTFVKTGSSLEESIDLSKVAIQMQHTADETLEASDAAETLIAVMRAYGATSDDASHVSDAINNVSANFAVSSGQIITNIGKVAATMSVGNTSLEETLGLITGITEVTRNASKASNALKTIGQRLRGVGEDAEEGLQASLQSVFDEYSIGVQIMDEKTGEMASTFDILKAIASRWDDLTEAQRQNLGELAAGKNRITEFNALMLNFDQTLAATEAAYNSAGVTAQQFSVYQESIEGKSNALKEQWQELVAEGGGINKFIKLVLDAGTAILKFANSDLGQAIIKIGAFGGGVKLFTSSILPKLIGGFDNVLTSLINVSAGAGTFAGAMDVLTASMMANPLFWAVGAGLLIFGLAKIIETDAEKFERLNKEIDENNQKISELQSEYDQLNSKAPTELTTDEKERLKILQEELTVLKNQTKEKQKQAYESYKPKKIDVESSDSLQTVGTGLGTGAVNTVAIQDYIKTLNSLEEADTDARESMAETAKQLDEFKEAGIELNKADQEFLETYDLLITANQYATDAYEKFGDIVGENVANAVNVATSAIKEQNEQGVISQQTYNALIAIYPDLIDKIKKQGNGYVVNTNALKGLMTAENLEKISINQSKRAAIDYINTLGGEKLAYSATTEAIKRAIAARLLDAKARMTAGAVDVATYNKMTKAQQEEYLAGQAIRSAAAGEYSKLQSILSNFNTSVNSNTYQIDNNTEKLNDNTAGLKDNTKATTENAKAKEKERKELEKANKEYDKQTKKLEDLIETYKNAADAYKITADYMVDQIDKEIDALEKRRDAVEDSYNKQIEKLQQANAETEKQIELEKAQQALAEARQKKVLVFKGGKLQYQQDAAAVQEAQANLDAVKRQQQQEAEIAKLEAKRDKEVSSIDKQIENYEKYKQQWQDLGDAYENEQNRLIAQQVLGIKLEGDNWKKRLKNAKTYTDKYMEIMRRLGVLEGFEVDVDTGSVKSVKKGTQSLTSLLSNYKTQKESLPTIPKEFKNVKPKKGFAGGTTSTPTGIYKVGEFGEELMVGKGAGIISHNLTENLMKLGQFSPVQLIEAVGKYVDRGQTVVQQFGDISLPNVTNANQFVEELKHFNNYAVQATSRR